MLPPRICLSYLQCHGRPLSEAVEPMLERDSTVSEAAEVDKGVTGCFELCKTFPAVGPARSPKRRLVLGARGIGW